MGLIPMCGVLFWWCSIPMAMMLILMCGVASCRIIALYCNPWIMQKTMLMQLMPCVVSSMLMPFSCPVVTVADAHGTDAHKPDSDAVTGIYAVDTMPMAMRPASSGGDRHP